MSVSLIEVLERAGYDVKNNIDDARWLLGQQEEFEELVEIAEELDEKYEEYQDYCFAEDYVPLSFEEWRKRQ